VAELLGGGLSMMIGAEVAGVAVDIRTALGERRDVIDLGRRLDPIDLQAPLAKAIGAGQAA